MENIDNSNIMNKQFKLNQLVWWNDPSNITSGIYKIVELPECQKYSDGIYLLIKGNSEIEAYQHELEFL